MKHYTIKNISMNGGWTLEEGKIKCIANGNPVIKRLKSEIDSYRDFGFELIDNNLYNNIKTNDFKLKFKIIIEKCEHIHNVGSFIRSTIRLLTNFNPKDLLFILDLTKCQSVLTNIKKNIMLLINSSTTAIAFTNVYLLFDKELFGIDSYKKMKEDVKNTCVFICDLDESEKLLNSEPFYINLNSLNKSNLFNNFDSSKQYILIIHKNVDVTTFFSPIIHNIASYPTNYLSQNKNRTFVVCIEKLPNLYRVYSLFTYFNLLQNLIIILPNLSAVTDKIVIQKEEHHVNNICNIIDECKLYNIQYKNILEITKKLEDVSGINNIVAVDLHKDAYVYKYGDKVAELNNSFIIFGFESTGIPKQMLSLCKYYLQLEARSSINVVASISIILNSLY